MFNWSEVHLSEDFLHNPYFSKIQINLMTLAQVFFKPIENWFEPLIKFCKICQSVQRKLGHTNLHRPQFVFQVFVFGLLKKIK